jgi:tRNA dimethylallyltransferase
MSRKAREPAAPADGRSERPVTPPTGGARKTVGRGAPAGPADEAAAPLIAVVGATGSGKTALAVELAVRLGGEIVNTDSLQVYRHLDIGTAKPTAEERARAVHHLLDVVDPDQPFSAADYVSRARAALARLAAEGRTAILCGGAGLYFRALTEGLADVPEIPAAVRGEVQARLARLGTPACHAELARLDPVRAARLHPNDTARVSRALEVVLATGEPLSGYHGRPPRAPARAILRVGLAWERAELYARLDRRVTAMLAAGWIDEVRRLLGMGFPAHLKPLRAIGYREIVEHLEGRRTADSLAPAIQQRTRNYAKRQLTWFRHQAAVHWFPPGHPEAVVSQAEAFLAQASRGTCRAT